MKEREYYLRFLQAAQPPEIPKYRRRERNADLRYLNKKYGVLGLKEEFYRLITNPNPNGLYKVGKSQLDLLNEQDRKIYDEAMEERAYHLAYLEAIPEVNYGNDNLNRTYYTDAKSINADFYKVLSTPRYPLRVRLLHQKDKKFHDDAMKQRLYYLRFLKALPSNIDFSQEDSWDLGKIKRSFYKVLQSDAGFRKLDEHELSLLTEADVQLYHHNRKQRAYMLKFLEKCVEAGVFKEKQISKDEFKAMSTRISTSDLSEEFETLLTSTRQKYNIPPNVLRLLTPADRKRFNENQKTIAS